ncbi:hypothetical protein GCM10027445_34140 [Amycolatopsis endophytica]|uniref:Uncharacterized protein YukE n=1 Tax=Amycolatopsis endophytica TaxID=860233 RepID=A0A853B1A6_9PSEU|nr:toxin glutamine deamidase domain-containing protein [Amycolatopsis endophytica]NYI88476.1 uncharacterized protein YukE [Amycolatopsis endophytica]
MGMEFPDEVKWLLPIVVGESWPEGDEDKLRELRDAWQAAAEALEPIVEQANSATSEVLSTWTGAPAIQFQQLWDKFVTGDEAYFINLTNACNALAKSADSTALDVEYTKYMIIASLIILAIQIAAMIAAAVVTFGGSTAGIVPAQMATRMTVQMVFKQLVQKMLQEGFRKVAMQLLRKLAKEVLINVAMNLALDVGIQGLQVAKGDRELGDWDFTKTAGALASGVAGGVAGAAGKAIPKGATEGLQNSVAGQIADRAVREGARGAVEGVATTVGQAALTGDLDQLRLKDVAMGASAGAVDRATGGAKDQINEIKSFNADIRAGNIKVDGSPVDTGGSSSSSDSGSGSSSDSGGSSSRSSAPEPVAAHSSSSSHADGGSSGGSVSNAIANDRVSGQSATVADRPATATTAEAPRSTTSDSAPAHQSQSPVSAAAPAGAPMAPGGGSAGAAGGSPGGPSAGSAGSAAGSSGASSAGSAGSSAGSPAGSSAGSAGSSAGSAGSPSNGAAAGRVPVAAGPAAPSGPPSSGYGPAGPTTRPDGITTAGYTGTGSGPTGGSPSAQHGDRVSQQGQQSQMPPAPPMHGYPGSGQQQPFSPQRGQQGAPQGYRQGPPPGYQQGQPRGPMAPQHGGPQGPVQGGPRGPMQAGPQGPVQGGPQGPFQGRPQGPVQGGPQGPFQGRPQGPAQGGPPVPGGRPPMPPQQGGYGTMPQQGQHGPMGTQPYGGPSPQARPYQGAPQQGAPYQGAPRQGAPQQGMPPRAYGPPPQQPPHGGRPGAPVDPRWALANPSAPRDTAAPGTTRPVEPETVHERTPFDPPQNTVAPVRGQAPTSEQSPFDRPRTHEEPAPARDEAPVAERSPLDPPRTDEAPAPVRDEKPASERTPFDPPEDATPVHDRAPTSEQSPFDRPRTHEEPAPARDEAPVAERSPFDPPEDAPPVRDEASPAEQSPFDEAPPRDEVAAPADSQRPDDTPQHVPEDATPQHDRPVVDEPYIADPDFRTHDRADFDALGEVQLNSGLIDEHTGRLTHEHEFLEALQMRDLDATLRHMTDNGAYAVHSYTSSEVFGIINNALRTGQSLDAVMPQIRALVSGLNEIPAYQGETVRRVNVSGEAAAIVAGRYQIGQVMVESQFLSSSRSDVAGPKWPGDVEMIIEGKTGRYIEGLASNKAEHEVLYKPGTQLVVKDKIEVDTPGGGKKFVIRLEEITPDDPRFLPPEAAKQQMDANRERADRQEAEIAAAYKREIWRKFSGGDETGMPDFEAEVAAEARAKPDAEPPGIGEPANGWGDINRSSDVVGEPAIHARSTDPVDPRAQSTGPGTPTRNAHQEVRFLRDNLPEIADVNTRGYYADGMPVAHRTNSAESVIAFEHRMNGIDAQAHPAGSVPHGRDFLARQLGGEFRQMTDYNSVVRDMAGQPVGSRAVLSVDTPDGQRAFSVVHTEHGVALVDPMTSRLADLPPDPSGVHLMDTHTGDGTPPASRSEPAPPQPARSSIADLLNAGPERTEPVRTAADSAALRNRLDGPQQPGARWNPFRRSEQPPAAHPHQQPPPYPPHQYGQQPVQHGGPQQHQQPHPYQQGAPVHPNQAQPPVQHGVPQHQQPNPYQQGAPVHPNQAQPAPQHQQGPYQQAPFQQQQQAPFQQQQQAPFQQNPYQQQAPFQQNPYQQQQQAPFQHQQQGPLPQQGVPLLQNQPAPWSNIAAATQLHNLPAIHGGTAGPHQAAYVASRHPELPNVNPNRNLPNATDLGYWHNCTRCVVAYAQRLIGIDAQADPVLPRDVNAMDRMKWMEDQLGAKWVYNVGNYDNVIHHVSNMPHGAHAVVHVAYKEPDGSWPSHVALAVNTPEGVVFVDPQNGGLMNLPTHPTGINLLPFGSLATSNGLAANPQAALPHATPQAPHVQAPHSANVPILQAQNTPVQQPPHLPPPVQQPPVQQAPVQQPPVQQPPVQQPPVQQAPVQQAPVQQPPVQQPPVQQAPPTVADPRVAFTQPPQATTPDVHAPTDPRVPYAQRQATTPDVPVDPRSAYSQQPKEPGRSAPLPDDGAPDRDSGSDPHARQDDTPSPEPRRDGTDDIPAAPDDHRADDLPPGDDTVVVDGQTMRVDDAFQRLLDEHPELRQTVDNNPAFRQMLLTNLGLMVNLITYPDAIPVVQEAWDEQLPMPHIPNHINADFTGTPGDLPQPEEQRQPQPSASFPAATPSGPGGAAGIGDQIQPGFDPSRAADPAYADAYLRDQLDKAAVARQELDSALGDIAGAVGGTAVPATSPSWEAAQQQLAGFDGDASRMTELAAAGLRVGSAEDAYRAADQLAATPGMEVLSTDDRLADGGALNMRVRTSDGTVGGVSMMPPMAGMPGMGGAGGGTSRGGRHRKFEGPRESLVEDVEEVPTPQYFKCFNKTYKVDRDGEGNLTGYLLDVRTGEFGENAAHLEKVLQAQLPSNFRSLTEPEFVAETERERSFYLRGEGPLFTLYDTIDGVRRQAKEDGRALTAHEESFIASVQRRTFAMWESELARRAAGEPAGFVCTSILA